LVEAANEALRPAADAKGIKVETEVESGSCFVSGDPNRLRQVIWNLVMNAIKFTPRGGKVNVRLDCFSVPLDLGAQAGGVPGGAAPLGCSSLPANASAAHEGVSSPGDSYVRLTVSDTGEGMKPEFLPYVFHRFRQEESSMTRKAGGLGLGLAVVRHLVELHGGSVSADSAGPGQGSTFIVELPLAPLGSDKRDGTLSKDAAVEGETKSDVEVSSSRGQLAGIRVLLVEDDEDTRVLLQVMLERRGAEVVTASSSAEAFQWFTEKVRTPTSRDSDWTKEARPSDRVAAAPEVSTGSDSDRTNEARTSDRVAAANEVSTESDSDRVNAAPASAPPTSVDIIISDLGMPEEDGYEFMRKIRLLSPYSASGIPAIALTGYATLKDRERALSVGYQFHLAKPVEPEALVDAILTLLEQKTGDRRQKTE